MTHPTSSLSAVFADRRRAERAIATLSAAGIPGLNAELAAAPRAGSDQDERRGVVDALAEFFSPQPDHTQSPGDGPVRVRVSGVGGEGLERAVALLGEAGGRLETVAEATRPEPAPDARAVQPGFADTRPGFIPRSADYPEERPEMRAPQGRFADQLDHLPPDRSHGGRAPDGPGREDDGE